VAHQLESAIRDDLVRVHVRRRSRATLEDVEAELIVELALAQLGTRALDREKDVLLELAAVEVRAGGRGLHHGQGLDEVGIEVELHSGDVKILERASRLDAVVRFGGDGLGAEEVVFGTGCGSLHGKPSFGSGTDGVGPVSLPAHSDLHILTDRFDTDSRENPSKNMRRSVLS
jgi:hypothetical protein